MGVDLARVDLAHVDRELTEDGYHSLGPIIDPERAREVLDEIRSTRDSGPALFLTKEEFDRNPQLTRNNPGPGFNVIEGMDLSFIEENPILKETLSHVLGANYTILLKKAICGIPHSWMPDWVIAEMEKKPGSNMNGFLRPEHRDITYFRGVDWHQDIIDHKNKAPDFITMYVYLDDVTAADSPLSILPKTHKLGGTTYPHDLSITKSGWGYTDRAGKSMDADEVTLVGPIGNVAFWHAFLLHGTRPTKADRSRISLRYLIQKGESPDCLLDRVNTVLPGLKILEQTLSQTAPDGTPIKYENLLFGPQDV